MNLVEELKARELVEHHSAELEKIFETKRTVYLGVDPSADSMHAGHLVVVLTLKRLADAGHRIILLVGGGTGMIGDPRESGERTLADERVIKQNSKALRDQMQRIVGTKVTLVNNADWLLKIKLVDFLRDIGKHFTVNELIKRDIIRKRLETPDESISYTEFAYSLLQGYDYLILNQKYGTDLQIGASDQWTNILSGVELIRRKLSKEAFALCTPLITEANGKKFGKSEGNAVWLDPKKTSPFAFYQFWLNADDSMVERYLKFFTFLPLTELNAVVELHRRNPERRTAQRKLAEEVTRLVHGEAEMKKAEKITDVQFGGASVDSLTADERKTFEDAVPTARYTSGMSITDALTQTGFVSSKSEVRRLIDGKGIKLNGEAVTADRALTDHDFDSGVAILQKGKSDKLRVLK